jgi:hypothetical protein
MVARLERMFPSVSKTTAALKRVLESSRGFDYPEFPEPKTLLLLGPTTGAEVEIDANLLAAWICHINARHMSPCLHVSMCQTCVICAEVI